MTPYEKRLIELGEELLEQMEAEMSDDLGLVPILLQSKINFICGYIDALKIKK